MSHSCCHCLCYALLLEGHVKIPIVCNVGASRILLTFWYMYFFSLRETPAILQSTVKPIHKHDERAISKKKTFLLLGGSFFNSNNLSDSTRNGQCSRPSGASRPRQSNQERLLLTIQFALASRFGSVYQISAEAVGTPALSRFRNCHGRNRQYVRNLLICLACIAKPRAYERVEFDEHLLRLSSQYFLTVLVLHRSNARHTCLSIHTRSFPGLAVYPVQWKRILALHVREESVERARLLTISTYRGSIGVMRGEANGYL
jgi:hypothetical protein